MQRCQHANCAKKAQNALNARIQKFQTTQNDKKKTLDAKLNKIRICTKCQNKQNTEHTQL